MASTPTVPLTVNVPVDFRLKFIDVWPNDLSKNGGKGYGASLALTGELDGKPARIYPKGFLNRNIDKLVWAGVIEEGHYPHDPAEKYSIPVKTGEIRVVNSQPAGEKHAAFDILNVRGVAVPTKEKLNGHGSTPAATAPSGQVSGSVGAPAGAESEKPKMRDAYKALTQWVLTEITPLYENAGVPLTPEAAAACVQTLFIQAAQRGKID